MRKPRKTEAELLAERIERDRQMIRNPGDWPRWPVLPLKLRTGDAHDPQWCGFLLNYDFTKVKPTIYFGNIFCLARVACKVRKATHEDQVMWSQVTETMDSREFADIDALLALYTID
jgi:hypothetical protein